MREVKENRRVVEITLVLRPMYMDASELSGQAKGQYKAGRELE